MAQFGPWKQHIDDLGGNLVFVAAEKKDGMFNPRKFLEEHPTPFPFLLDEDRTVTKTYGVYHRLGIDAINIAHPATFVVGRDGLIRYIYVGSSQTDRPPVETVIEELKKAP
jgi:peroxiredoxin Q/BCP